MLINLQLRTSDTIQEHARRQRTTNMALCTATDPGYTVEQRLSAVKTALAQWDIGSFGYQNVLDQVPELVAMLEKDAK